MSLSVPCPRAPLPQPFCPYCLCETQTNALIIFIFISFNVCQWKPPPNNVYSQNSSCDSMQTSYAMLFATHICHLSLSEMQWIFPIAALTEMVWSLGQEDSDGILLKCFLSITLPAFWPWGFFLIGLGFFYFCLYSPGNSNSYIFYNNKKNLLCQGVKFFSSFLLNSRKSLLSVPLIESRDNASQQISICPCERLVY